MFLPPHRTQDDRNGDEDGRDGDDPGDDFDSFEFVAFRDSTFDGADTSALNEKMSEVYYGVVGRQEEEGDALTFLFRSPHVFALEVLERVDGESEFENGKDEQPAKHQPMGT
ncbi:7693_t:CDS:2 [Acaulospora colombiana]|uniref:7693_t:CDS:1 n=1 Tax=Acaulospora colombiana TaxID=27376 RepID=A0ACA9M9K4_9GLOM|nr:7693_t:CDS:2 [Acaulospora colombiana]